MGLNNEQFLLILALVFSALVFTAIALMKRKSTNKRNSKLWVLIAVEGLFFSIGLFALLAVLPQSLLNIFTWVVYDFLITYVLCVEVPAYLSISNFDDNLGKVLKGLREELILMPFSFGVHLQQLKTKRGECISYLDGENLNKLLEDFISLSDKLGNLNEKVWSLTLNETSSFIDEVEKRSKHPFPKLIDILALSGLSLLLAQFLKFFG